MSNSDYINYALRKGWSDTTFSKVSADLESYYSREFKRHGISLDSDKTVIDLGFGNGEILGYVRSKGATIYGIEVQSELLAHAKDNGFTVFSSVDQAVNELGRESLDVITAYDVFEHLTYQEMVQTCTRLRSLVKGDVGYLMARFPNGDSPFSSVHQNGDHTHRQVIGKGIVESALNETGWKLVYLGSPAIAPRTYAKRVQYYFRNILRWCLEKVLAFLYFGKGGPSTFDANYVLVAKSN